MQTAWNQLTTRPAARPDRRATVAQMVARHAVPPKGSVDHGFIPAAASQFTHRGELVYLPPAYFATNPPPTLPTVMMIGGEFNTLPTGCARAMR